MTDDRSLERAARTWLEDGPDAAPDRAVDAALERIETTRQERGPLVPWRNPFMTPAMKLAGVAVLVVAAVAGSLYIFGSGPGGFGSGPQPSPTVHPTPTDELPATVEPTASPSATPFDADDPNSYVDWTTYTSEIHDLRIGYPSDWEVEPAGREWDFDTDAPSTNALNSGADLFAAPHGQLVITVWKVAVEEGTTLQDWVATYCDVNTTPCDGLDGRLEEAHREVRDQHLAGALIEFQNDVQAFMPSWAYDTDLDTIWTSAAPAGGGEIIAVAAWQPGNLYDSRALVDGFSLQLCDACDAP